MSIKLKVGNYIHLSEIPDEETYQKVKQKFIEAGCFVMRARDPLNLYGLDDVDYIGWCYEDGFYPTNDLDHIMTEDPILDVDESYYVSVRDLLAPSSPEDKIAKILSEEAILSQDFIVDLLQVYLYKGFLNDVSLVIPNVYGDFYIDLVVDLNNNLAKIRVTRESNYEELTEDYSITIPLPDLTEE